MRKTWGKVLCVVGILALTWGLRTAYIVGLDPMRAFTAPSTPAPVRQVQPRVGTAPTPTPTLSPEEALSRAADADFMKNRVNILLVGFDQSPERDEKGSSVTRTKRNNFRSDVLMLAAIDFGAGSVHLMSIPRDTYTPIYNTRGRWKINAAFAKGGAAEGEGFDYAMKTVEMLMGVPVPYYAGVNMVGLKRVVDAIGGVDYDVDVEIHLNGRTLYTGPQRLDGQQVLDYVRARKGISTDVGRNDRQQRMLLAVFDELKKTSALTAIPAIYGAVKDDVYTNLTPAQIAALAKFALSLDVTSFKRTTLDGEYVSNVYNASYYVLRNKSLVALVEEEFGVTIKRDKKYDLSTVKRDKAAAAARRAAAALEDVQAMLVLPADTTGAYEDTALHRAELAAQRLTDAIDSGAETREIRRMQDAYMREAARLLREHGISGDVPEALGSLVTP